VWLNIWKSSGTIVVYDEREIRKLGAAIDLFVDNFVISKVTRIRISIFPCVHEIK
jgi:hypothetical protein